MSRKKSLRELEEEGWEDMRLYPEYGKLRAYSKENKRIFYNVEKEEIMIEYIINPQSEQIKWV